MPENVSISEEDRLGAIGGIKFVLDREKIQSLLFWKSRRTGKGR